MEVIVKFKKIYISLFIVTALVASLFPLALLVEKKINDSLDLNEFQKNLSTTFQQSYEYKISTRGVYFDILDGIVFNGVRLYKQKKGISSNVLRADRLILEFSIIDYFIGSPPIHATHIRSGEWLIPLEQGDSLTSLLSSILEIKQASTQTSTLSKYFQKAPTLFLHNIKVNLFNARQTKRNQGNYQLIFDLEVKSNNKDTVIKLQIKRGKKYESDYILKARGVWKKNNRFKIHFTLHEIPIKHFFSLLQSSPMIPLESLTRTNWLKISSGILTGAGSIETYDLGIGFNLKTTIKNLNAFIITSNSKVFGLDTKKIHLDYNSGWVKNKKTSFLKSNLYNDDFYFNIDYKDTSNQPLLKKNKKQLPTTIIKSAFTMDAKSGVYLKGFQKTGKINFSFSMKHPKESSAVTPEIDFLARGLKSQSIIGGMNNDGLSIESLSFQVSNTKKIPATLKLKAGLNDAKISVSGEGKFNLHHYSNNIAMAPDMSIYLHTKKLTYKKILTLAWNFHKKIIFHGSRHEAARAEDKGPLWKKKFLQSNIYLTYIRDSKLKFNIILDELMPSSNFPKKLLITGRLNNGLTLLNLKNPECVDCKIRFKYKFNMQREIPRHDIELTLNNEKNEMPFEILTGSKRAPTSYSFQYFMAGDGWLAGDILHRSFSRFNLNANKVYIADSRILKLLTYGTGLTSPDFHLSNLRLKHGTDGPRVQFHFDASHSSNSTISSHTSYKMGYPNSSILRFHNRHDQSNRSIKIILKPNNTWTPLIH